MGIIKRQSIYFTIISYIGLGVGALNTLLLMPHFLTHEQVGLVSVFTAIAFPLAAISNAGSIFAINRFLPYYKKLLPPAKIDLPVITVILSLTGFVVVMGIVFAFKGLVFDWFSHAKLLLDYFYLLPVFTLGYLLCSIFQALNNGYFHTVWVGIVTEVIFRVFNLILIAALAVNLFDFDGYIHIYVLMFWVGIVLYIGKLKQGGDWVFFTKISKVTRKLKEFIIPYSAFFWFTSVFSVLATMIDTIVLAGVNGLEKSGSLMIATYFITVTQIPQRSIVSVSIPVIAESWRNKDIMNIAKIYRQSANNMLWAGGFIFLCILLNINEILAFLPKPYHEIKWVIFILGIAKLLDYITGVNQNILALSRKNWKLDLYTNILLILLLIPLNYFLIKTYGIIGAAFANLIGYFIYNSIRTYYVYAYIQLTPFNKQNGRLVLVVGSFLVLLSVYMYYVPVAEFDLLPILLTIVVKSTIFLVVYVWVITRTGASEHVDEMLKSGHMFTGLFTKK